MCLSATALEVTHVRRSETLSKCQKRSLKRVTIAQRKLTQGHHPGKPCASPGWPSDLVPACFTLIS